MKVLNSWFYKTHQSPIHQLLKKFYHQPAHLLTYNLNDLLDLRENIGNFFELQIFLFGFLRGQYLEFSQILEPGTVGGKLLPEINGTSLKWSETKADLLIKSKFDLQIVGMN